MIKGFIVCLYIYLFTQYLIPIFDILSRYFDFLKPENNKIILLVIGIFSNILFILIIILGIWYIISSIKLYKGNNNTELRKNTRILKFSLLPYWILNFFCLVILLYIAGFFNYLFQDVYGKGMGIGILISMIIIPNIIFAYIILGISSCASIAYIKMLKNENKIQKKGIHILLQLCFILDIVDILILEKIIKNENKISEVRHNRT
jgi:hypothetical protein